MIAEAGSNHMQNLKRAFKLIDIASNSGADAIKFQTFTADEIATKNKKYNIIKNKFKILRLKNEIGKSLKNLMNFN